MREDAAVLNAETSSPEAHPAPPSATGAATTGRDTPAPDPAGGERSDGHLLPAMVTLLERAEVGIVATADAHGECDSSLRTGPPGFVRRLDEQRVAYPEYRGNGVMASLGNIEDNPHLGLMLIDFAHDRDRLHLSGTAELVSDTDLRAAHPDLPVETVKGRRTDVWVVLTLERAELEDAGGMPALTPVERPRAWGTDDMARKGGDFFGAKSEHEHAEPADTPGEPTEPTEPAALPVPVPVAGTTSEDEPHADTEPEPDAASASEAEPEIDAAPEHEAEPEDPEPGDAGTDGAATPGGASPGPSRATSPAPTPPPPAPAPAPTAPFQRVGPPRPTEPTGPGAPTAPFATARPARPTAQVPPGGSGSRARPGRTRRTMLLDVLASPLLTAGLAVLVVLLLVGLIAALNAGPSSPTTAAAPAAPTAAPSGPTGPPTLYGRVVDVPDPGRVILETQGQRVPVSVLGIDATAIPRCAAADALSFARRTLDQKMVTVVPDPTVAQGAERQAYIVLPEQLSYTDAMLMAGWAQPAGTALYRPTFDSEARQAERNGVGMFGPPCQPG